MSSHDGRLETSSASSSPNLPLEETAIAAAGNADAALNLRPTVSIATPVSYVVVTAGTPIILTATAADAEDGVLTPAIVWTSSLQGKVGSGGSTYAALVAGTHRVTAAVDDAEGSAATASVVVVVRD